MNLTSEDKLRIWKALASYIDECNTLAKDAKESGEDVDTHEYYLVEANEAAALRHKLNIRE